MFRRGNEGPKLHALNKVVSIGKQIARAIERPEPIKPEGGRGKDGVLRE